MIGSLNEEQSSLLRAEEKSQLQLVKREDINDEEDLFEGINADDVKKLQDAGISTCNGLMMHTKKNFTGIKGLYEAKVDKICEAAEKIVNFGYITGSDALTKRKSIVHITTGSQALDELLGGGFKLWQSLKLLGNYGLEKHNLHILTACLNSFLLTCMEGMEMHVAYIDTERTFRPELQKWLKSHSDFW